MHKMPGCGSWTGCRDPCVSTFKDATSDPSQKTPWKGIEFLHLVAGLSGIQLLASGQAATPAPEGGVPSPPEVGGPGVGSPRAQSQSAAGACQVPEGIRAQHGSPVPTSHAAAPELAVRPAPLRQDVTWYRPAEPGDRRRAKLSSRPPRSRGTAGAA